MIQYREFDSSRLDEVKEIYESENRNAYLRDDAKLRRAFDKSLYILGAFDGDSLAGFARCVGGGEHILLVQDLIVRLQYRRRGIGKALFGTARDKFADVRMFHVVTDANDPADNGFYRSFGMKQPAEGGMVSYFR